MHVSTPHGVEARYTSLQEGDRMVWHGLLCEAPMGRYAPACPGQETELPRRNGEPDVPVDGISCA
jgi:hypothetical protein